jgi:CheY-like chemotaxis protein
MFFNTQFNILAVDDEPDVLSLTKMLLRDVEVYGLPVHVETAQSKAEAIEIFNRYNSPGSPQQMISVAFIDVVMETEHAGLELCDYIRNEMNNYVTQLFIRTGQPGTAPEREVIDKYDINGYFTKTELDETKLYSLVKSGIRQANTISNAIGGLASVEAIIVYSGGTRQGLEGMLHTVIDAIRTSNRSAANDGPLAQVNTVIEVDGHVISSLDDAETKQLRTRLLQLERHPLNDSGDYFTADETSYLVYVAPSPTTVEAYGFSRGQMEPSPFLVSLQHKNTRMAAAIWKQAANGHDGS